MGRIEGYERIKHPEMGSVVVEGRAVRRSCALAVLLDNALRYSPPAASVHVSLEQGHHACFLIVDDAGLRMDDERLLWASDVMSGEQRDDITRLGAHPQTGLRVASLLAENYGFRVELTAPNIYQGTRAMVVLPKNLLVDPAAAQPAPRPATTSSAAPLAPPVATPSAAPLAPPVAAPSAYAPTSRPAPTACRRPPAPAPAAALAAEPPVPEPEPAAPPSAATAGAAAADAATPSTTTASGLTVRRRTTAPAAARRPAAPDDTGPGRPAVAAAWAGRHPPRPGGRARTSLHRPRPGTDDRAHRRRHPRRRRRRRTLIVQDTHQQPGLAAGPGTRQRRRRPVRRADEQ